MNRKSGPEFRRKVEERKKRNALRKAKKERLRPNTEDRKRILDLLKEGPKTDKELDPEACNACLALEKLGLIKRTKTISAKGEVTTINELK